ncbi:MULTISPECIES: hypothetical protein [Methanosarcina]|nr:MULTISPECIES: hypothetical protein [Methanosarcina]
MTMKRKFVVGILLFVMCMILLPSVSAQESSKISEKPSESDFPQMSIQFS